MGGQSQSDCGITARHRGNGHRVVRDTLPTERGSAQRAKRVEGRGDLDGHCGNASESQ